MSNSFFIEIYANKNHTSLTKFYDNLVCRSVSLRLIQASNERLKIIITSYERELLSMHLFATSQNYLKWINLTERSQHKFFENNFYVGPFATAYLKWSLFVGNFSDIIRWHIVWFWLKFIGPSCKCLSQKWKKRSKKNV